MTPTLRKRLQLLLTICVLALLSVPAVSQNQRGVTIYGRVFLPDSAPGIRLTVNIAGQNGFVASTKTDERGGFQFQDVPRAIYGLSVSPVPQTQYFAEPVSVNATIDGSSFMADIFLRNSLTATPKTGQRAQVISVREASQNIPKDAHRALERAQKYREQKQFAAALNELDKAIALYPEYFQAFTEKGIVQINSGDLLSALRNFGKAIDIFPEYEPAFGGAGYCLVTLGYFERALPFLEKAVQLDAADVQSFLFLGIASVALSHWQRAQDALERALKVNAGGAVMAHIYLAEALAGQQQFARAADELHTYLQLKPNAPDAERLRKREKDFRSQKLPAKKPQ